MEHGQTIGRASWANVFRLFVVLATLASPIVIAVLQRPLTPGKLRVAVLVDAPLVARSSPFDLPVKIQWHQTMPEPRDVEVQQIRLVDIELRNVGEQVFDWQARFGGPATIRLQGDGRILEVVQVKSSEVPRIGSTVEYRSDRRSFLLSTEFLNPNDYVTLRVIHSGAENALQPDGRIRGQEFVFAKPDDRNSAATLRLLWHQLQQQELWLWVVFSLLVLVWRRSLLGPMEHLAKSVLSAAAHVGVAVYWGGGLAWLLVRVSGIPAGWSLGLLLPLHATASISLFLLWIRYIESQRATLGLSVGVGCKSVRDLIEGRQPRVGFVCLTDTDFNTQPWLLRVLFWSRAWVVDESRLQKNPPQPSGPRVARLAETNAATT